MKINLNFITFPSIFISLSFFPFAECMKNKNKIMFIVFIHLKYSWNHLISNRNKIILKESILTFNTNTKTKIPVMPIQSMVDPMISRELYTVHILVSFTPDNYTLGAPVSSYRNTVHICLECLKIILDVGRKKNLHE